MNWSDDRRTASSATHGHRQWRRLRARRLALDGHQCQLRFEGVCTGRANTVDVIVPMSVTGPRRLELADVQSACVECHRLKTAREANAAAARKRAIAGRRRPQPRHPADTLLPGYRPE